MNICLNLGFLKEVGSADFLTYLLLLLAYFAYEWSVSRDLDSWKSLFISFKTELETYKQWLGNEYFAETYEDITSFDPRKIIFPLAFVSLPEIIRRGASEFPRISDKFINQLSL